MVLEKKMYENNGRIHVYSHWAGTDKPLGSEFFFIYEPRHKNTGFSHMRKISAFVFAARIVQFLFYLNPKLQFPSHFLWLYNSICVGPGRKPRRPVFSQRGSYIHRPVVTLVICCKSYSIKTLSKKISFPTNRMTFCMI